MIPRRRREEQFSFASSRNDVKNGCVDDKVMEYDKWAERIKAKNEHFGKTNDAKLGAWTRRKGIFDNCVRDDEDFRWLIKIEGDDSGTPSPQLWRDLGSPVSKSAGNSPISRAQEIEKFRKEMINLARDMPENGYELSLRDMVESPSPRLIKNEERRLMRVAESTKETKETNTKPKKSDRKTEKAIRKTSRTDGMEVVGGGLLLKMFTPAVSVGGVARRKMVNTGAKVSPRPSFSDTDRGGGYSTDGEWWTRNELGGSGNSSSGSSSNSSKNSTITRIRKMTGCYSFLLRRKTREV